MEDKEELGFQHDSQVSKYNWGINDIEFENTGGMMNLIRDINLIVDTSDLIELSQGNYEEL